MVIKHVQYLSYLEINFLKPLVKIYILWNFDGLFTRRMSP